jgi:hypothetical protein
LLDYPREKYRSSHGGHLTKLVADCGNFKNYFHTISYIVRRVAVIIVAKVLAAQAVMGILEILVRFRIRLRILLFLSMTFRIATKNLVFSKLFCLLLFEATITVYHFAMIKSRKEVTKQ